MAVTVEIDKIGSMLTAGVSDARRDRGVRIAFVNGLTNNNQKHKQALDAIIGLYGTTYHVADGPPLDTVDIRTFGPTSAWATLRYARHSWSGFGLNPFLFANVTLRSISRKWYRDTTDVTNGLPDGPMTFWPNPNPQAGPPAPAIEDRFATPIAWQWTTSNLVFHVPFDLQIDPTPTVAPKVKKANDSAVEFNGYTLNTGQVIFRGMSMAITSSALGPSRYRGTYVFEADEAGFFNQKVIFNEDASPVPKWETINFTEYTEMTSFVGGAFPG